MFTLNDKILGSDGDDIDGMTTMFHLTEIVAQKLKTLFGFISETLVQKTTNILNAYSKDDFQKLTNVPEAKAVQLVSQMLAALTVVFTHNQVEISIKFNILHVLLFCCQDRLTKIVFLSFFQTCHMLVTKRVKRSFGQINWKFKEEWNVNQVKLFQVESLLIKNYEDHVNAVLVYINAPIPDEKKDEILNKVQFVFFLQKSLKTCWIFTKALSVTF